MKNIILGDYYADQLLNLLSKGIKRGDPRAIKAAAKLLVEKIPNGALLIPVPSRTGSATYTLSLAREITELNPSISVCDCLKGKQREDLYSFKKQQQIPDEKFFEFQVTQNVDLSNAWLLDNVFATGCTVAFCSKALGKPVPYIVLARDYSVLLAKEYSNIISLKNKYPNHCLFYQIENMYFVLNQDCNDLKSILLQTISKVLDFSYLGFPDENRGVIEVFARLNKPYLICTRL